jgi:hypothetical protein
VGEQRFYDGYYWYWDGYNWCRRGNGIVFYFSF